MLKKFGMITVGVTAGLLAVAPMASASDHGHDHDRQSSGSQSCDSNGGDASAEGAISESEAGLAGNALTQAPIGGASIGAIASCNENVLNDNISNNEISIADDLLGGGDEIVPASEGDGDE